MRQFYDVNTGELIDPPAGWYYGNEDNAWHKLPSPEQMKSFPVLDRMDIIAKLLNNSDLTDSEKDLVLQQYNF